VVKERSVATVEVMGRAETTAGLADAMEVPAEAV
jgi:hypothetical protein